MLNFILYFDCFNVFEIDAPAPLVYALVLPLFKAIFLSFVEQIGFRAAQIDNFWTPVSLRTTMKTVRSTFSLTNVVAITYIFLLNCALFAVVCIRYSRSTANDASALI